MDRLYWKIQQDIHKYTLMLKDERNPIAIFAIESRIEELEKVKKWVEESL